MSATPNKRLHEEAAASGSSSGTSGGVGAENSKYPNDDSAVVHPLVGPKLGPSVALSDYHHHHHPQPFDHAGQQDSQIPVKIRSPLLPMYHNRVSPSSNVSHFDHPVAASENRSESRDNARDLKAENRDARDSYQSGKEKESKEAKHDRDRDDNHPEYKDDSVKTEKEGYGPGNSHLSWKESKEHHRGGKRYPDILGGIVDPLHASRANLQGPVEREAGKEFSTTEERDYCEAHEAVGENKFDLKGEDKFKERDRKRKDLKHRDWLDKDKNERRNNLHLGSSSGDGKEPVTEEREAEKWERERKDLSRDKEKPKEREKDHVKREAWNGAEKDGLQNDKEPVDAYARTSELENSTLEQKKLRDHDGWKNNDGEARERRKGRDADVDEERPEKRSRWYDKDSDDGCADTDLGAEKEREVFSYGVQQRKRMLRPRGSPQVANREPRFRSRTQDNEGKQGKHEASTVVYRVGECMEELMKLWKEYEASQSDRKSENSQNGPTLEIRISAEHVTATNRQVRGGQLWGTDVYTYDSDLVAILMHTGYCRPTASPPPPAIQELRATVRVLPPQDCYISTLRNNVRSRAWGAAIGCSYRVERCCIVKKGGGTIALEPCLTHTSTLEPTLAPVVVERTMTTRAAASNALRQQRFVREVTIQYNLCNEPWIKYSLSIVADKGLKKPLYTSARLKKGEVLYLETHSRRYELCFTGERMVKATSSQMHDMEIERSQSHNLHSAKVERGGAIDGDSVFINVFRWSHCKKPIPQKLMLSIGIPLPLEHLEVLEENLDWEDIQWSQTGVFIAGKEFPLARVHFLAPN
ncbi:uncharacterized protein LOC131303396 [Rhododendron vialii]|uniref:uncharacterized protein LOC131303396 n=1 Tax=Rhododendron vialii TaxID=182163 RepID=UPI00265E46D5|nr:uncharacterized protein LOC131303396 [Rhododendron vialii]